MANPICPGCRHFAPVPPHQRPQIGTCRWHPTTPIPPWLDDWLGEDDDRYGPRRKVWVDANRPECPAFEPAQAAGK